MALYVAEKLTRVQVSLSKIQLPRGVNDYALARTGGNAAEPRYER